jgi:hypothetical protein
MGVVPPYEESVEEDENDGVEPREAQRAPGVMP